MSGLESERGDDHFVLSGADDNFVVACRKVCEGKLTQFVCRRQVDLPDVAQELNAEGMGGDVARREYLANNDEIFIRQSRMNGQGNFGGLRDIDQLLLLTLVCNG